MTSKFIHPSLKRVYISFKKWAITKANEHDRQVTLGDDWSKK